jgi:hypothetical protein
MYFITGECISSIFHIISQDLGDFEGILYGNQNTVKTEKLMDNGEYQTQTSIYIQNMIVLPTKILHTSPASFSSSVSSIPLNTLPIGWISSRKECPASPSLQNISTLPYLQNLLSSINLTHQIPTLIFGIFTFTEAEIPIRLEIEDGQQANCISFDFKFFNASQDFTPIRVEIENLKNTSTAYNSEKFICSREPFYTQMAEHIALVPNFLLKETEAYMAEFDKLLPEARSLQLELEKEILENITLKSKLFNAN